MKPYRQTIISVLLFFSANAQEKPGIQNSNYSSTNSIFLNPSSTVDSRTYIQVNLAGASAYLMNNVMYFPKFSLWSTLANGAEDPEQSTLKLKKFLQMTASVEGPAFVISKRNYGAGIFVRARSVGELKGVPYKLTELFLNLDEKPLDAYPQELDVKRLRVSNMTWVEYGLNFGWMVKKRQNTLIAIGGNLKYITGVNVAYGNIIRLQGSLIDTTISGNLDARVRYNQAGWATGRGVGMDFGFTYKKMLGIVDSYYANSTRSNCKYIDYKYKIGISLKDVGAVRFKKGTTQVYVNGSGVFNPGGGVNYEDQFRANFNAAINNNPILSSLPTALSAQFDYNFENKIYLNATILKNMVPGRAVGVQGADLLYIAPRFELRNFEVSLPLAFRKYMYPQLGLAFRIRSFVLGVDNLFPLIIKKKTYGAGVYFNLGFSFFRNPACKTTVRRVDDCAPGFSLFKKNKKKARSSNKKQRLGGKKRRVFQSGGL